MGFLFSKLWALFGKLKKFLIIIYIYIYDLINIGNEEHKIIIVGLDNAGKKLIITRIIFII